MKRDELSLNSGLLYERLGGAAGIARIVDDIMADHLTNPVVGPRFRNISDLDHAKKMACDFFCAGAGGPEKYVGKDMRAAHRGMNVNEQEYVAVMDDIMGALGKNGIDEATKKDVLAILYSLKGDIVRQ